LLQAGALSGAAAFREYWTFESDFLNGLYAGAVVLLASQQAFPAMGQAQPKFAIVFIAGIGGQLSTLLDLVLEEIGCFKHSITQTKRPAHRGFYASQNAAARNWFRQCNKMHPDRLQRRSVSGSNVTGDCRSTPLDLRSQYEFRRAPERSIQREHPIQYG
jgi:hypothetical protein